ncbi:hypothetical protein F4Z99_02570 [Candidatus Poribacteria bacterium]|nr:hypothetical protein [Candidatus Poribacteria bacterium]MYB01269.1 hypothetical protein [Candidatus Poribacteria bacterium]
MLPSTTAVEKLFRCVGSSEITSHFAAATVPTIINRETPTTNLKSMRCKPPCCLKITCLSLSRREFDK